MSKPKTPTASGISRLLSAAGFTRSESVGRAGTCSGFEVRKNFAQEGSVRVRYYSRMSASHEAQRDAYSKHFGAAFVAEEVTNRLRPEVQRALFGEARSVWLDWLIDHATVTITRPGA